MGDSVLLIDQVDPQVMSCFIMYSVLLTGWIMTKAFLTAYHRLKNQSFSNPEDGRSRKSKALPELHPDVVRVNRMHQNDLENIVPFFFLGLMFCMSNGSYLRVYYSKWIFRLFFCGRVGMSVCHYFCIQPFRSLCFMLAMAMNITLFVVTMMKIGCTTKYL